MKFLFIICLFFCFINTSQSQDLVNVSDSLFIDSITKLNLNNKKSILFENKYNEAIDKFNLGKFKNAILLLDECVKLDSTSANSYFLLSKCYYNLDLKIEFLQNIKKALFIDSTNVVYISEIGNYYRSVRENDSANFYYDIITENFPNFPDVFYWKSLINIKNEDYSSALDNINKAINIEEKDYFFNERAGIYRKQKNFNKSLLDYKICIEINRQNKLSFNNRGEVFLENGDIDNAKKDFKKSLEIDSSYTLALNNLSICFYNNNELDKTIELLNKCIEIQPNFVTALVNRGIYYQTVRDERKACEDWKKASKLGSELAKKFINNDCF